MSPALLLCIALAPWLQAPAQPGASAARAGPRAVLVAADGSERAVPLDAFEVDGPQALAATLVRFQGAAAEPAAAEDAAVVELAGGEVLCGAVDGGEGERFQVRIAGGRSVPADLERIHALRFPRRLAGAAGVEPAAEGDRVFRVQASGVERIDGAVEGFTEGGVRFHGALVGTIAIPWRSVAALFVEHMGSEPARAAEDALPVALDLVDGTRLAGLFRAVREHAVELDRRGETLRIPLESVLQLARDDGSIAFLADLAPRSSQPARPFGDDLGMVWAPRVDRNVSGGPLRAGGQRHPRGLGVHAPSRATWSLDGRHGKLRGAVALDDEVLRLPTRGSCVFRVLGDGRELYASPVLRAGEPPVPFTVVLAGVKELALVVEPTEDGFAGDRADWLGLVLSAD